MSDITDDTPGVVPAPPLSAHRPGPAGHGVAQSPFVSTPVAPEMFSPTTARSPFASFSEVEPVEKLEPVEEPLQDPMILPPAVAQAFSAAGADAGELDKIHELLFDEVEGIGDRVGAAIDAGEKAVVSELEKLRAEFGFGPAVTPKA